MYERKREANVPKKKKNGVTGTEKVTVGESIITR